MNKYFIFFSYSFSCLDNFNNNNNKKDEIKNNFNINEILCMSEISTDQYLKKNREVEKKKTHFKYHI